VTGVQSNGAKGPKQRVPTAEQLPPLVARSPLAIFDEAVTLLRVRPVLFLSIAGIVLLPMRGITALIPGVELRGVRPDQLTDIFIDNLARPGALGVTVTSFVLESIALMVVAATYAEVTTRWISGHATDGKELAKNAVRRFLAVLGAWIIAKLAMAAASVFTLGIGGFVMGTFFAITAPILGAERLGPYAAIRRSMSLVSSKVGQTMLVFICTGLGAFLMRLAIKQAPAIVISQFFGGQLPLPDWAIVGVFDVIGSVVALSFVAASSVVLYLDLRVRREGIDLRMAIDNTFPTGKLAMGSARG